MTGIETVTAARVGAAPTSTRRAATPFNVAATAVLLFTLMPLVYYLWMCLAFNHGEPMLFSAALLDHLPMPTPISVGILVGWFVWQIVLQIFAPGRWVEGPLLADGTRLKYKMNGWFTWWFTWAALTGGVALHLFPSAILADQFGPMLTTMNLAVALFCVYLYWHGKILKTADERSSGNALYDFWLGTALNPRIGSFDLKLFCEARPGLIGWVAIDFSLAAKQAQLHGSVTLPMIFRLRVSLLVHCRLLLSRGGHPLDLGHQAREFRLDAVLGRSGVGALHLHYSGLLPRRAQP